MYIKLFEEYHIEDYQGINNEQFFSAVWGDEEEIHQEIEYEFIIKNWEIFTGEEGKEIKKCLPKDIDSFFTSHFGDKRYFKIDNYEQNEFSNDFYIKNGKKYYKLPSSVEIYKLKDEWFFVEIVDSHGNEFFFKCDQMYGLKKLLGEYFI